MGEITQVTKEEKAAYQKAWEGRCAYCRDPLTVATQDHVRPLSKGGEHTIENILPSCMRCNQLKSSRDLGDFLVELYAVLGGDPWKNQPLI